MKHLLTMVIAMSLCLALFGCAEQPVPQQETREPLVLQVVTSFGLDDGNRKNFESAVAEYEAATGNVVQDNSAVSNEEWKAKVLADFETGSEPDVLFFFTTTDSAPFIKADKVVPISEIRREFPAYADNIREDRMPLAENGESYAVPVMGYWENLYVNKRVLADCGIAVPGSGYTWEQFLRDCAVIRSKGYTPIACSLAEVSHYWFEYAVMNNGTAEDHLEVPELDETGALVMDETAEKWIAGLDDIRFLYEQGYFPENTLTAGDAETVAAFGDGRAAFLLDGSWKVGYFRENYADRIEDYALCCVPGKGERQATDVISGISAGYFITRKAWADPQRRKAAVDFVSHLTSDSVMQTFVTTEFVTMKNGLPDRSLDPLQLSAKLTMEEITGFSEAVQDHITGEARSMLFQSIRSVVTGEMSAHDAIELALSFN